MMEQRRRVPRQEAGWEGKYLIDGVPEAGWDGCRVLDLSVAGVGLELFGRIPRDLLGRLLDVEASSGTSVGLRLRGAVRNVGPGPEGGVRVGLEFTDLSETERLILNALHVMQVGW